MLSTFLQKRIWSYKVGFICVLYEKIFKLSSKLWFVKTVYGLYIIEEVKKDLGEMSEVRDVGGQSLLNKFGGNAKQKSNLKKKNSLPIQICVILPILSHFAKPILSYFAQTACDKKCIFSIIPHIFRSLE